MKLSKIIKKRLSYFIFVAILLIALFILDYMNGEKHGLFHDNLWMLLFIPIIGVIFSMILEYYIPGSDNEEQQ